MNVHTDPPPGQPAAAASQVNGLAIASVLLAVLWLAGIGAVLALVFGYRARSQINNSRGMQTGSGLATAGIILGWIGITILAVGVLLILLRHGVVAPRQALLMPWHPARRSEREAPGIDPRGDRPYHMSRTTSSMSPSRTR